MQEEIEEKVLEGQFDSIPTPSYIIHKDLLESNLKKIEYISSLTGIKFMFALKSYSYIPTFELINKYVSGCVASGIHEAKLSKEYFSGEIETFSPAFEDKDFDEILKCSDTIVFNSFNQLMKFKDKVIQADKEVGIRVNITDRSFSPLANFDPSNPKSRFGVKVNDIYEKDENGVSIETLINDGTITYLHTHAVCETLYDGIEHVIESLDEKLEPLLKKIKKLNIGGGVLYTDDDFDVYSFSQLIKAFWGKYDNLEQIIAEPGTAVTYNSGTIVAKIIDIVQNGQNTIATLNSSAQNHLLDSVLIESFQPDVFGADYPHKKEYTYILSSNTCLSIDTYGEYSFDEPLEVGQNIIFMNTSYYSHVTTSDFNGIKRPSLIYMDVDGSILHQRDFGYEDFKRNLE